MSDWVFDSSALLAYVHREPGAARVEQALDDDVTLCSVNLCEVATRLIDQGVPETHIRRLIEAADVQIVEFTKEDAYRAAALRPLTRHAGLALGDRACLALAMRLGAAVLTADRVWAGLPIGVTIELLR